jgi:hypothetical protein
MDSDGLPQAGLSVVLVPELSQRENYQKYKTGSTDHTGTSICAGLRRAITNYSVGSGIRRREHRRDLEKLKEKLGSNFKN